MPEVSYIGYEALHAKAIAALERGVTQAAEDLVHQQQAAAPVDTGTLRASIHLDDIVSTGDSVTATTATGGESSEYAIYVHEGTREHVIKAADGHYLDWPGAEHPVKEVTHPATAANRFMSDPLIANRALYQEAIAAAARAEF